MSFARARARWREWQAQSANRKIFAALVTVGALTVVAKLATVAKDIVVASRLGTADALDAFLVALAIPSFVRTVVGGSLASSLVPTLIRVEHDEGRPAAQRLLAGANLLALVLLAAASALMWLGGPVLLPLVGTGFSPAKLALTLHLYHLLVPIVCLTGLSLLWSGVLNAENRFALAAFLPFVTPTVTVLALLLGRSWGVDALAIGAVGGAGLEALILCLRLATLGIVVRPRWRGLDAPLRQVIGQCLPMAAGAVFMSASPVIDQAMASMLGGGAVSALSYGNKLVAVAIGVGALALSTAVLPHLSRMVAAQDFDGVRRTLRTYARLILVTTIPATLVIAAASRPIVALLFQRGAFTPADTTSVAGIQLCYFLQVPFYLLGTLAVQAITALKANRILLWVSVANVVTNTVGDWVLMHLFGAAGIALSTAVVYVLSSAVLSAAVYRLLPR
jgi:putative peptidoglycan lipid II flippase